MFFDAVLDSGMNPVYNDTPENVREWLKEHATDGEYAVYIGNTVEVISVDDYLNRGK